MKNNFAYFDANQCNSSSTYMHATIKETINYQGKTTKKAKVKEFCVVGVCSV